MFKAKRNFKCNGLSKKEGEKINQEESKIIERFVSRLIAHDILEEIPIDPKPLNKKKRKSSKRKGV